MHALIQVIGDDANDRQAELWQWLRDENGLDGRVTAVLSDVEEGRLGAATDLIGIALGSAGACAALTRCVTAWLEARHPTVRVRVRVSPGERSGELVGPPEEVRRLLEELLADDDDG